MTSASPDKGPHHNLKAAAFNLGSQPAWPAPRLPAWQLAWLSDGRAGHDRQSQALVAALWRAQQRPGKLPAAIWQVNIGAPWQWFAPFLPPLWVAQPSWPQLDTATILVGCGRRCAQAMRYLKAHAQTPVRCLQILDPRHAHSDFDVLLLPQHDRDITQIQRNAPPTLYFSGSLHDFGTQQLSQAQAYWRRQWQHNAWPRPWLGLLLGDGAGLSFKQLWQNLAPALERALAHGGTLLCTSSRRTPAQWIAPLRQAIATWSGKLYCATDPHDNANPYLGLLSLADELWISGDSMNMLSEALSSHGYLRLASPPKRNKHRHYVTQLTQAGLLHALPPSGPAFPGPARTPQASPAAQLAEQVLSHWNSAQMP